MSLIDYVLFLSFVDRIVKRKKSGDVRKKKKDANEFSLRKLSTFASFLLFFFLDYIS